jgi:hypothetical protein
MENVEIERKKNKKKNVMSISNEKGGEKKLS